MNENTPDQQVGQVSLVKKILGAKVHKLLAFFFIASGTALTLSLSAQIGPEFAISDAVYPGQASVVKSIKANGSVQGAVITNGLNAYWAFDEGAGTTTADGSGNGKTGTLVGSPTWVNGKSGGALQFSGTKRVNVVDTNLGNTPYTTAAWVNTTSGDGWITGRGESSDLRLMGGKVLFQLYTSSGYQNTFSNTSVNNGQWRHIAVTRSGSNVSIYIDGVLDKSATIVGTPEGLGFTTLASRDDSGSNGFVGSIDEVYVFNRALSGTEVSTLYAADNTAPTVSVTAPANGATVSGTSTTITANASDNVGVVGVQFKLNGTNLGSEDTVAPYSYTWNTTTATNGANTITAVARDAAGNPTTSIPISVTVNNQTLTAPTISFFTASPSSITAGQSSTLSWSVTGSQPITLKLNGSTITGTSTIVYPTINTTYTLTATNSVGTASATTTVNVTVVQPATGLVGYWAFDEGTGTTTADGSGNGKTGTLVGSPTWVNGKSGKALQFTSGKSVNIVDTYPGNSAYTAAAWVNTTSGDGWIMGQSESGDLRLLGGKVLFQIYTSSGYQNTYSNSSVNNGQWRHIAATLSGTTVSIYIDGVLDKTATISATPTRLGLNTIAARTDNSSEGFTGTLDELRVYNKTLTAAEVAALANVTPPTIDTTPPTISIISPTGGSISGTVPITVNAQDNVGVAGVQFKVGSQNIGSEVTTAPFTANFNTTSVANGDYTLTAVARDAANNLGTSTGINVTINNQQGQVAAPVITPGTGTYTSIQSATITTSTSGATIRYTTNGTNPTASSTQYTGPLTIASSGTVKARAFKSGMTNSTVTTANYTINLPPANTPPTGFLDGINTTNRTIDGWAHDVDNLNVPVQVHLYVDGQTNGTPLVVTANAVRSDVGAHGFNEPIPAQYLNGQPHTVYAWAIDLTDTTGASNRLLSGSPKSFNFGTPPIVATPTISPNGGTYTSAQTVTITDDIPGATIRYTTNGTNPTSTTGTIYTAPITISTTSTVKAIAYKAGMIDSNVGSASYTINIPTAPTINITAPSNGATVSGTSTDITASASDIGGVAGVQFKLNGNNLGAEDTTAPYSYTWNTTTATNGVNTITAVLRNSAGNTTTSAPISVTVNNQVLQVATPTISPNGGTFTTAQTVTLATTTSGASIRYTTDGSNPTSTFGTLYSSPFTISTTSTVKAFGYKTGMTNSAVASASFTINTVPPAAGCDHYAGPAVTSGGDGTYDNPWALRNALTQPNLLSGNKTLCLKGGTYLGKFSSSLNGGTVRSAPGEFAILDGYAWTTLTQTINPTQRTFEVVNASLIAPSITQGGSDTIIIDGEGMHNPTFNGNTVTVEGRPSSDSSTGAVSHAAGTKVRVSYAQLEVQGNNTIYRDLEITNSDPLRNWATDGGEGHRGAGVFNTGSGNKFYNNVIHDNLNGIFSGNSSTSSEYYGNILYNNGAFDVQPGPTGAGHGAYIENSGGYMRFYENLALNNFNHSIQLYGRSADSVGGDILGNVFSGAGKPLNSGLGNRNVVLGPEQTRIPSVNFSGNFMYHPLNIPAYNMILGYGAGVNNGTVTNNYFIGGEGTGFEVENTTSATITGNKFYLPGGGATNIRTPSSGYVVNNNTYYGTGTSDEKFGVNGNTVNFNTWKSSGYDASGSASASAMPDTVLVRANEKEGGRANIIVMAPSRPSSVTVNLSQAGLSNGQSYVIKNASNWKGSDLATGTYNSSSPNITIQLSGAATAVARPNGLSFTPTSTCPELCAFVVVPTSTSGGFAAPTPPSQIVAPPTTPTNTPAPNVTLTPGVSNFKYASSATIYFLNTSGQKEAYSEAAVFLAWNSNYDSVVTIPESQTYLDAPYTVRLPEGKLVKVASSSTIYITEGATVRPFASLAALISRGYSLSQVITISVNYLHTYSLGETMN